MTRFPVNAQEAIEHSQLEEKPIQLSGFGSLGFAYNTSQDFDYLRDLLQSKGVGKTHQFGFGLDSLIGLQVVGKYNDALEASLQTIVRHHENNYRPEINWAFLKYLPDDNLDLRIGRLGFDVYPLADSRNVAFSYIWVRPPVEYFGGLIVSYLDGADAVYRFDLKDSQIKIKLFTGQAKERAITSKDNSYFSLKGSRIIGGHVEYQRQNWLGRLGISQLRFKNDFPDIQGLIAALNSADIRNLSPTAANLATQLSFKDKTIQYLSAGLVYDDGPFQAQFMLSKLDSKTLSFDSNLAGFFTAAYRVKNWTPYFTLAKTRPRDQSITSLGIPLGINPEIDRVDAEFKSFLKATRNEQSSIAIGLRYNLNATSDLKVQIDHIHNQQRLIVRSASPNWNGKGTILSATYNFIFN
ncbi:hypothetical protein [Undibacterium fentianense]|uniref:Porin n=1 Tax=Undibacterium fentianense TaxID=2828728 RepID=A0A941E122_9BURK|nr:hypothetical protein [Undibacterium fentianense]MBR7799092.1 hypothetical protein [Undibacterium fentianense]